MDVLWDVDVWLTAREVAARLDHERDLAYTTVLTVLERLERKGFVQRERAERAHRYRASSSRDAVVAEAMLAVLDTTEDRSSALVRFVGSVSPAEAEILRRALAPVPGTEPDRVGPTSRPTDVATGEGTDEPGRTGAEDTHTGDTVSGATRAHIEPPSAGRGTVHPL